MARLGCASTYTAVVNHQGGEGRFFTVTGAEEMTWERVVDDFSEGRVVITKAAVNGDCARRVGKVEPWAHELRLYRDGKRVWEGPVFDLEEDRSSITILARDPLAWLSRRAVRTNPTNGAQVNAAAHAGQVISDALSAGGMDPNLLPFLLVDTGGSPATERSTQPLTSNALNELVEIARAGLDFFAVGRQIVVRPDRDVYDRRPFRLRETDLLADFRVRKVGAETATKAYVAGGAAPGSGAGSPLPVGEWGGPARGYGLVENVSRADNTHDTTVLSGLARRVVGYGNPAPVTVSLPQNAQLSPDAQVSVEDLVPGQHFEIAIRSYAIRVLARMKLNQVQATWQPDRQERIAVSLVPKNVYDLPPGAAA